MGKARLQANRAMASPPYLGDGAQLGCYLCKGLCNVTALGMHFPVQAFCRRRIGSVPIHIALQYALNIAVYHLH